MTRKEKYTEKLYELFTKEGGSESLTMNDIAQKIGVTKMTLYNHFKDKKEIVEALIGYRSNKFNSFMQRIDTSALSAIEALVRVIHFQKSNPMELSRLYAVFSAHFPEQFKEHEERFKESLRVFLIDNIVKGQAEGIYRQTVEAEQISSYILMNVETMLSRMTKGDEGLDMGDMHHHVIEYHLRGMVNEKGMQLLNKYMSLNRE